VAPALPKGTDLRKLVTAVAPVLSLPPLAKVLGGLSLLVQPGGSRLHQTLQVLRGEPAVAEKPSHGDFDCCWLGEIAGATAVLACVP